MSQRAKLITLISLLLIIVAGGSVAYRILSNSATKPNSAEATDDTANETVADGVIEYATDFTVLDEDGNEVSLSDYVGKPVIVNFWATWCGPCRSELPLFDEYAAKYKDEITFLMVDLTDGEMDTIDSASAFKEENGYSFDIYFDINASALRAYEITGVPQTIAVDENGILKYKTIGAIEEDTMKEITNTILPNDDAGLKEIYYNNRPHQCK